MGQLDLLWELEEKNKRLREKEEDLDLKNQRLKIEDIGNKNKEVEMEIETLREKASKYSLKIRKNEGRLKGLRYKLGEIEEELYSGSITDLSQLEHLDREKEDILLKIDRKEEEVLSIMEEEETVSLTINKLKSKLANKEENLYKLKEEYEKNLKLIKEEISQDKEEIDYITSQIQTRLLEKYKKVKGKRERPIVKVDNNICSGCNMRIPTYILSALKNKEEIIYCENCSRILYIKPKVDE